MERRPVTLSVPLFDAVMTYLGGQPYAEVAQLIQRLADSHNAAQMAGVEAQDSASADNDSEDGERG